MPNTPPNLIAGGTITCYRFVKVSTTEDDTCLQATAGSLTIGVSQAGSRTAPLSDIVSTNEAAQDGESVQIYGPGDVCLLEAGAVVTVGDPLKSDSVGRGVTATSATYVGAIALQGAAAAGVKIRVFVTQSLLAT